MTYPPSFVLDPDSIPEGGDSARFWTPDRRATAVVTGIRNGLGQSLADLLDEAAKDVTENSHGVITYSRSQGQLVRHLRLHRRAHLLSTELPVRPVDG